jgi:hypothetical protein
MSNTTAGTQKFRTPDCSGDRILYGGANRQQVISHYYTFTLYVNEILKEVPVYHWGLYPMWRTHAGHLLAVTASLTSDPEDP